MNGEYLAKTSRYQCLYIDIEKQMRSLRAGSPDPNIETRLDSIYSV